MGNNRERRRNPRVLVRVRMEVKDVDTGQCHVLHTSNLSVGGARCVALGTLREGALLEGHVFLPLSEAGRDVDIALPVRCNVLRCESASRAGDEYAVQFDTMSDADRAELASYLYDWLASDSWSHAGVEAEAIA